MAHKQLLHELLKEEQEPFHLNTYIADRCSHLKKSSLQIRKRKPITDSSPTKLNRINLCKNACFFSSFQNSPDFRKSPFQSPCKSPNPAVFLHVPAKTAAILVEAAMRIQTKKEKRKSQIRSVGFGLFGSVLKRLKDRTKNRSLLLGVCDNDVKITKTFEKIEGKKVEIDARISSSCDAWSSTKEEKSMDLDTWTSSCSEEIEYVVKRRKNVNRDFGSCETRFCSSPFRFSLQKSAPSSDHRTPELTSPAVSPSCRRKMEKSNCVTKSSDEARGDEDEEKENFSPVSVLDPPFEESAEVDEEEYDLECNYANVQRAKQQLLCRLRRFEKLAKLDPMELERKLLEGSSDEDEQEKIEGNKNDEPFTTYKEHNFNAFVHEVFNKSSIQKMRDILPIVEQKREIMNCLNDNEEVFDGVDLMIKLAFGREQDRWTGFKEHEEEIVAEVEIAIFEVLVEELSDELLCN